MQSFGAFTMDLETHLLWMKGKPLYHSIQSLSVEARCTVGTTYNNNQILFSVILGRCNFLHKHTVELAEVYCVYALTTEPKSMFWMAISWCHVSKPSGHFCLLHLPSVETGPLGRVDSTLHASCCLVALHARLHTANHAIVLTAGWCLLSRAETLMREQGNTHKHTAFWIPRQSVPFCYLALELNTGRHSEPGFTTITLQTGAR